MKFFKSPVNLTFIAVILLLVAGLIFSVAVITEKNSDIKELQTEVTSNNSEIQSANERITEIEAQLGSITEENNKVKSELEKAQQEKDKLTQENSTLKKSIEQMSAAKQQKAQTAVAQSAAKGERICYLTFDDGPSENTLKILEILKKYNAKATFFVIDTNKIDYVKQIYSEGHTVGLHSASHRYDEIYTSFDAYFADLAAISDKVKNLIGVESKIIRFPGGSSNSKCNFMPELVKQVAEKGYFYFDWNVDSCDASGNNVSYTKIKNSVLSSAVTKNSICVLMHDTDAKSTTVTALPEIIEGLQAQGYVFKALTADSYGYHHNID